MASPPPDLLLLLLLRKAPRGNGAGGAGGAAAVSWQPLPAVLVGSGCVAPMRPLPAAPPAAWPLLLQQTNPCAPSALRRLHPNSKPLACFPLRFSFIWCGPQPLRPCPVACSPRLAPYCRPGSQAALPCSCAWPPAVFLSSYSTYSSTGTLPYRLLPPLLPTHKHMLASHERVARAPSRGAQAVQGQEARRGAGFIHACVHQQHGVCHSCAAPAYGEHGFIWSRVQGDGEQSRGCRSGRDGLGEGRPNHLWVAGVEMRAAYESCRFDVRMQGGVRTQRSWAICSAHASEKSKATKK